MQRIRNENRHLRRGPVHGVNYDISFENAYQIVKQRYFKHQKESVFYYLELTDCEFLNCLKNDLFHKIIREKVYDLVNCTYINTSIYQYAY
jgi:hypothetical protein